MKEDYLWDKTGEDPEIERLETALQMFRYTETSPPALPAKIFPFERKTPRSFFRLAFAFAACAALVIICLGVWFQFSHKKIEVAKDSSETIAPPVVEKVSDKTPVEKQTNLIARKIEQSKQSDERKIIKIRKVIPAAAFHNKTIAQNIKVKKPIVRLTKEEKYAYNQLMLALSITSSKLKLVEDKIYGVEEPKNVLENGR